jgi:hypothetical protein
MPEDEERASVAILRTRLGVLVSFGIIEEYAPLERCARMIDLLELYVHSGNFLEGYGGDADRLRRVSVALHCRETS